MTLPLCKVTPPKLHAVLGIPLQPYGEQRSVSVLGKDANEAPLPSRVLSRHESGLLRHLDELRDAELLPLAQARHRPAHHLPAALHKLLQDEDVCNGGDCCYVW